MSLRPQPVAPVPDDTTRVARAAFPKGNPYLTLRDALGTIFQDADFAALFPPEGQPSLPPWHLALVTILQFRENLTDRQAAEAVALEQQLGIEGAAVGGERGKNVFHAPRPCREHGSSEGSGRRHG